MRNLRFWFSLVVLVLVVGLGSIGPVAADIGLVEEGGAAPRCNCWYPNSNTYGVRSGEDCPSTNCWVGV